MMIDGDIGVPQTAAERDPRWVFVLKRDKQADGAFFYSVKTTGIYCLPSCASRRANPKNVQFHATAAEAEAAGFRACHRCKPNDVPEFQARAAMVARICRSIDESPDAISLTDLAGRAGLSIFHFHRVFKSITGVTPKDYAKGRRRRLVQQALAERATVTEAIYGAGYNAQGRFYADADGMLGMTPRSYRAGGQNARITFAVGECTLGSILAARSERGVCCILLGDNPERLLRDLQDRFPRADLVGGDTAFEAMVARVVGFVEAPGTGLNLPLDIQGTAFQIRVWQALQKIPVGETRSYSALAREMGLPNAARAIAGACAANKLAVEIPCHRVVRTDGSLSGYRWGVERKKALLARESG
jgi:AraC family transcriptional regulator of adaptative response/methylated-DNA-[protein]-cysteine methyltransferase